MDKRRIRLLKILVLIYCQCIYGMELIEYDPVLAENRCAEIIIDIKPDLYLPAQESFSAHLPLELWQNHIVTKIPKNDHAWYWCACVNGISPGDAQEFAQIIKNKAIDQETSYKNFKNRLKQCTAFSLAKNKNARIALQKALAHELTLIKAESETWKQSVRDFDHHTFSNYLNNLFESEIRQQWEYPDDMRILIPAPNDPDWRYLNQNFIDHAKTKARDRNIFSEKKLQLQRWKLIIDRLKNHNIKRDTTSTSIAIGSGAVINFVGSVAQNILHKNTTPASWWYLYTGFFLTGLFLIDASYKYTCSSSTLCQRDKYDNELDNCYKLVNYLRKEIESVETEEVS